MRSRPQAPQPRSINATLFDPTGIPCRYGAVYRSNRPVSSRFRFLSSPSFFSSSPSQSTWRALNRVLNKTHGGGEVGGSWKRSVSKRRASVGEREQRVVARGGGDRSSYRVRCIFIRPYIIPSEQCTRQARAEILD